MDPYDILISPYRYLGLIWVINILLFYYIFRTIAYWKTVPEWEPVETNVSLRYRQGFMTHKYIVELSKHNPGGHPVKFVEFVHKEVLFNIAFALGIKVKDAIDMLKDERLLRSLFFDEDIIYFLKHPTKWMRQYPYIRTRFFIFRIPYISPELQDALNEMIRRISMSILSRSEHNE